MHIKTAKRNSIFIWLGILLLLGMEAFFFRNVLNPETMVGDAWDGRLTMLFTEHWYHVFRGEHALTDMGFFYPATNTLAYSDMFLAFGLVHSLLRMIGLDMYLAFKLAVIGIHLIGTISTFRLLNRELKIDLGWSLFGTIVFAFSNTYAIHVSHTQLLTLSLVPLLGIFLIRFFRNTEDRKKRIRNAAAAILLLVLILYTAWYIFFFVVLFSVLWVITWICVSLIRKDGGVSIVINQIKKMIPELVIYLIALVLLMVPFALIELPVLRLSGGRSYGEVWGALPEAIDFINVSGENWLLGPVMKAMKLDERGYTFEVIEGFSIVLLIAFIVSFIRYKKKRDDGTLPDRRRHTRAYVFSLTVIICCILMTRLSSNGVSLWWVVYNIFPGATSIRAVARFMLFLSLPLAVITAYMCNETSGKLRGNVKLYSIFMIGLLIFAFAANIHTGGVFARWTRAKSQEFIENVPAPPEDCESFYLSRVTEGEDGPYYQLDAYQIADKYGIHTIHGYSGITPPGWNGIWNVQGAEYKASVNNWIESNHLEHVYAYDEVERTWTKHEDMLQFGTVFDAANKQIPDTVAGIWDLLPEGEYSWTAKECKITLRNKDITENGLHIKVGTVADKYTAQQPGLQPECTLFVNGKEYGSIQIINGVEDYLFAVEKNEEDLYEIQIKTNCYFIPAELGENGDQRELSLQLYYIGPQEKAAE